MSGRVMGTHQKVDRVARKQLTNLIGNQKVFPGVRRILHFEGYHGPDAIKRKHPAKDEPWHYFNPFDNDDTQLLELIRGHYDKLVQELKRGDQERSAFEAAWLAHALVDGLTPAHHYPYEEELKKLSNDATLESRSTVKKKLIMPGETVREQLKNNVKAWGPKGFRSAHGFFEIGVTTLLVPLKFGNLTVIKKDAKPLQKDGLELWFRNTAREVAVLDLFHKYIAKGWTPRLAWQIRNRLGPMLIQTVTVVWYSALIEAGLVEP